jgi:hypothetical protein
MILLILNQLFFYDFVPLRKERHGDKDRDNSKQEKQENKEGRK